MNASIDGIMERLRAQVEHKMHTAPLTISDHEIDAMSHHCASLSWEAEDRRQKARDAVEAHARRDRDAKAEAQRYRDDVIAALRPKDIVFRNSVLETLNDHAIELALEHRIQVIAGGLGIKGSACNRTITVPPVTNFESYACVLHEIGHEVSPEGDSRQFRYVVIDKHLIAIGGEIGAWRWAVSHAKWWMSAMQREMCSALTSYSPHATPDERTQMADFIKWANARVTDHPDPPDVLAKTLVKLQIAGAPSPSEQKSATESDAVLKTRIAKILEAAVKTATP